LVEALERELSGCVAQRKVEAHAMRALLEVPNGLPIQPVDNGLSRFLEAVVAPNRAAISATTPLPLGPVVH